jgi:glycosyltransferase involved in cell wall biosynthesis
VVKVTALLPVLNEEPYIPKCLESLLKLSTQTVSVVVSDNCSTDQSLQIISKYLGSSLKLIRQKAQISAVGNWRACFEESSTEFVFTIGGDDILSPNTMTRFKDCLNQYPDIEIFYFYFSNFDDQTLKELSTSPDQLLLEKITSCFFCGLKILLFNPSLDEFGLGVHHRQQIEDQALLKLNTSQSFFYWLGLLGFVKTCLSGGRIFYDQEISILKRQQTSYNLKGSFRLSTDSWKIRRKINDVRNAWVISNQINGTLKFEVFAFIVINTLSISQGRYVRKISFGVLNRWISLMHSRNLIVMNCRK